MKFLLVFLLASCASQQDIETLNHRIDALSELRYSDWFQIQELQSAQCRMSMRICPKVFEKMRSEHKTPFRFNCDCDNPKVEEIKQ